VYQHLVCIDPFLLEIRLRYPRRYSFASFTGPAPYFHRRSFNSLSWLFYFFSSFSSRLDQLVFVEKYCYIRFRQIVDQ
jgi:hypothetical protein